MAKNRVIETNKVFSTNFQKALSTITPSQWLAKSHPLEGETIKIYFLNPPLKLRTGDKKAAFFLRAHMITEVIDIRGTKDKKVKTREYIYAVGDNKGNPLLEFHWHPNKINRETLEITIPAEIEKAIRFPHIHIYANHDSLANLSKKHIPSGRVAFEDVLSFLLMT